MFAIRNLSVLAYTQGFTLWIYQAKQLEKKDILAPNFFSPAADMFASGDIIFVTHLTDGALLLYVEESLEVSGVRTKIMSAT